MTKASEADNILEKLNLLGYAGDRIKNFMRLEKRATPTQLERCQLRLLDIDHDILKDKWCQAMTAERRRFNTLDLPKRKSVPPGLSVANNSGRATVWLYGTIGQQYDGISAEDFRDAFAEFGRTEDVDLRIHSDGGDFFTALSMRSVIANHAGRVRCHIDGLAASAASLVAMACGHISIAVGGYIMMHEASVKASGRAGDLEDAAEQLRATNLAIADIYASRWPGSREELMDALARETWLNAEQCLAMGLVDDISDQVAIAAHVGNEHRYKHVPVQLSIAAKSDRFPSTQFAKLWLHRIWLEY